MPRKLLTDRLARGARSDVRTAFFGRHTRGLALRVTPTGAKAWYFVRRVSGSPSQWDRLGTVDAMSLADARKVARKRRTLVDDVATIDKYLRPAWGGLSLRDVTRAQVHELPDTLVADGMTVGVNRVQALISRLFTVAVDRSLLESHPAARAWQL